MLHLARPTHHPLLGSIALIFTLFAATTQAQTNVIDSLKQELALKDDPVEQLPTLSILSYQYMVNGDFEQSLLLSDSAMRLADQLNDLDIYRQAAIIKTNTLVNFGRSDEALAILSKLEEGMHPDSMGDLIDLGRQKLMIYNSSGQYTKAMEDGIALLEDMDRTGVDKLRHFVYGDLAHAAFNMKLWQDGRSYLHKKLDLLDPTLNSRSYQLTLVNLASQLRGAGEPDSAIALIEPYLQQHEAALLPYMAMNFYLTFGQAYNDIDSFDQGLKYLRKIEQEVMEGSDIPAIAALCSGLGFALSQTDRPKQALPYLRKGLQLIANTDQLLEGHLDGQLSEAFAKLEQNDSAYFYLKKFGEFRDSTYQLEKMEAIKNLEEKYESGQKDTRIAKQDLELSRQKNTRNILISSLCILGLLGAMMISRFRLKQKLTSQALTLQLEQNQNLQQKQKLLAIDYMVQGQEEERKRIAKDLHDGLGSLLTAAKLHLQNIHSEIKILDGLKLFEQAEGLIGDAHEEVQRIANNMMPEALMNFGLEEAVQDMTHQINVAHEVQMVTDFQAETFGLSEEREVTLYRIIQEAVNNAMKYAKADRITIALREHEDDHLLLTITDNGVGFVPQLVTRGNGLKNIDSRAKFLNGAAMVKSTPKEGTTIEVQIPRNTNPV